MILLFFNWYAFDDSMRWQYMMASAGWRTHNVMLCDGILFNRKEPEKDFKCIKYLNAEWWWFARIHVKVRSHLVLNLVRMGFLH